MELYIYLFFALYGIINLYILQEDLETKFISIVPFYIFVISSIVYYKIAYGYISGMLILSLYLGIILSLDIREYFKGPLESIGKNWMFLWSGIYDYFLYIFISALFISEIFQNIGAFTPLLILLGSFVGSMILWIAGLVYHQKKVKVLIAQQNISDYDELNDALYHKSLKKISYHDVVQNFQTETQEKLYILYQKRVPLFLFWNIFILFFVLLKAFL